MTRLSIIAAAVALVGAAIAVAPAHAQLPPAPIGLNLPGTQPVIETPAIAAAAACAWRMQVLGTAGVATGPNGQYVLIGC